MLKADKALSCIWKVRNLRQISFRSIRLNVTSCRAGLVSHSSCARCTRLAGSPPAPPRAATPVAAAARVSSVPAYGTVTGALAPGCCWWRGGSHKEWDGRLAVRAGLIGHGGLACMEAISAWAATIPTKRAGSANRRGKELREKWRRKGKRAPTHVSRAGEVEVSLCKFT